MDFTLGQVAFSVRDVAAATEFFRDVVGLRFLFEAGPSLSFFDVGGVRLMVTSDGGSGGGNSVMYFRVDSVPDVYERLGGRVTFEGEPHLVARLPDHELWMVFFRDVEGNLLAFMEERR